MGREGPSDACSFFCVLVLTVLTVLTSAILTSMTRRSVVQVRVPEDQVALWKQAAHLRQVTLSEWMRRVLTATAEKNIQEEE